MEILGLRWRCNSCDEFGILIDFGASHICRSCLLKAAKLVEETEKNPPPHLTETTITLK